MMFNDTAHPVHDVHVWPECFAAGTQHNFIMFFHVALYSSIWMHDDANGGYVHVSVFNIVQRQHATISVSTSAMPASRPRCAMLPRSSSHRLVGRFMEFRGVNAVVTTMTWCVGVWCLSLLVTQNLG